MIISDKLICDKFAENLGISKISDQYEEVVNAVKPLLILKYNNSKLLIFIINDSISRDNLICQTTELKKEYKDIQTKLINLLSMSNEKYKLGMNIDIITNQDVLNAQNIKEVASSKYASRMEKIITFLRKST